VTALHIGLMPMSFQKEPDVRNPRPWVNIALAATLTAIAVHRLFRLKRATCFSRLRPAGAGGYTTTVSVGVG